MKCTYYNTEINNTGAISLVHENSKNMKELKELNSPNEIVNMLDKMFHFSNLAEEHLYLLCFSTKMKLLGVFLCTKGSNNCSPVYSREIFQKALLLNASIITLCHNHPSGVITPSAADIEVTKKIKGLGDLMGITLMDHIISGPCNNLFSFKQNNLI